MKKILAIILSCVLPFTVLLSSIALNAFAETVQINKFAAFGDSIIYGTCQGKATNQNDSYGDQKSTNLLAKEYGLVKDATTTDKWFTNKSVPGNTTKQILSNIQAYDAQLLAQCDLVYMDGGINDACFTLSGFLNECGWGNEADNWTYQETQSFIEKNASSLAAVSNTIKDNFIEIIKYISSLEGFDGKIVIQNNVNPYTGSVSTNKIYLWDEFINRTVTKGQQDAIEATKDIYSNVVQLNVTEKLRKGIEYTGVAYNDSLHLTFAGNRAVYKELSLLLNPEGANLLTFESTEIPSDATWKTLYDFENYEVGDTNVAGIIKGEVSIADLKDVTDSNGILKSGYISGSTKVLKSSAASISVDFSAISSNIYGYRFNMISSEGTTGNVPNTFIPYVASRNSEVRAYIKTVADSWSMEEYSVDTTISVNGLVTSLNISDIQSTTYARIAGGSNSREYYIDDIQVLTTDTSLPEATTQPTSDTTSITTQSSTTTTTTSSTASSSQVGVINQTTGTVYDKLQSAISAATSGDTLKLLSDLSVDGTTAGISISKSLIIDLGKKTLTSTNKRLFNVTANSNATLTIKNGNIVIASSSSDIPIAVRATDDLVLEDLTVTGISSGLYGFVTLLSPSTADPSNITVRNCNITSSNYIFSDNNTSNAAWNLYIYNSDLAVNANSIMLKKDTAKKYDAIIYSGHIKNKLLNTAHYPNLTIADNSYMTTTENGSEDTATTAFTTEYWVYEVNSDNPLAVECNMVEGASIRLNEVNGIRFLSILDTKKIDELRAQGATVEYGTLIAPADKVTDGNLTFDLPESDYLDIPYTATTWHKDKEGQIAASIVKIKETGNAYDSINGNVARPFIGRAYVTVTLNGESYTSYASYADEDVAKNTRSLAQVSYLLKTNDQETYNNCKAEIQALIDRWADKYTA